MIYEQPLTEFDALSMAIAKNLIGYSGEASNRFDARLIPFPGRMVVTWSAAKVNNIVVGMAWHGVGRFGDQTAVTLRQRTRLPPHHGPNL